MLRDDINKALKEAMLAKETSKISTLRLINAAIKDRDIAARTTDNRKGISDEAILQLLQGMIKQRKESIEMYKKGNREDLVNAEQAEIDIISGFLPKQLNDDEIAEVVKKTIAELNLASIKDMGKAMAALREKYAGQMDFGKASNILKQALTGK